MPDYQILRCAKCGIFQIQQLKKVDKWNCVTCATKQSKKRVYAQSSAPGDLRKVVQEYNMKRGQMEEEETKLASLFPAPSSSSDSAILKDIQTTPKLHTRDFWEESKEIPKVTHTPQTAQHFPAKEGSNYQFTPTESFLDSDDDAKAQKHENISNSSSGVPTPTSSVSTPKINGTSPFATASQATDRWQSLLSSGKPKILSQPE